MEEYNLAWPLANTPWLIDYYIDITATRYVIKALECKVTMQIKEIF